MSQSAIQYSVDGIGDRLRRQHAGRLRDKGGESRRVQLLGDGALMADDRFGYPVYEKVATDAGGNIAFALIGTGVIWLVAKFWLGAAKVLFWVAAAVMALSAAHFLVVLLAGLLSVIFSWKMKTPHVREKWLWVSTAARLIEQILSLTALWLAARAVGYLR